jgi:hypothetical protein
MQQDKEFCYKVYKMKSEFAASYPTRVGVHLTRDKLQNCPLDIAVLGRKNNPLYLFYPKQCKISLVSVLYSVT